MQRNKYNIIIDTNVIISPLATSKVGSPALLCTVSCIPTWLQFFVQKNNELWCYFELSWGYQSTRQREVWESSKDWGLAFGMASGKVLRMTYTGDIY